MMLQLRSRRRRWSAAAGEAAAASSCRRRCPSRAAASAAAGADGEASGRPRRPRHRSPGTGRPLSPDRRRCSGTAAVWHQNKCQFAPAEEHRTRKTKVPSTHLLMMPGAERQVVSSLEGRRRRRHLGLLRARVELRPQQSKHEQLVALDQFKIWLLQNAGPKLTRIPLLSCSGPRPSASRCRTPWARAGPRSRRRRRRGCPSCSPPSSPATGPGCARRRRPSPLHSEKQIVRNEQRGL
jgi:hypothetical protein